MTDDESITDVPVGPPDHEMELAGSAPETVNLVSTLPEDFVKQLGERVFRDTEEDLASSEKFRERRANIVKLAVGILPPRPDGHDTLAQVHYPIIMTAVIRIHARMYDQQFPSNGEYWGVAPIDQMDLERSVRVAKHLNWQTEHQIQEYVPNHDAGMMQTLLYGSAFSIFYWNPESGRPCHEFVATDDIILPYARKTEDPHLADVPRITRQLRKYRHQLQKLERSGYYANVAGLYPKPNDPNGQAPSNTNSPELDKKGGQVQEVVDRIQGIEKPKDRGDGARVLWEQHCWGSLPGSDEDRPLIVTIDKETKRVLSIVLREDEDPVDRARFNREKAVNDAAYQAALERWQMDMQAYMGGQTQAPTMSMPPEMGVQTATPLPFPGEMTGTEPPMPGAMTPSMPMAPPPPQPEPPPDPEKPRMVPINFFTHFVCIPNPEGIYGLGIGSLLEGHNMVADVVASQLVEAATLANAATFVYSKQAKLSRGEFEIRPGAGVETDLSPDQVDKGIKILTFPPPNPSMGQIIKDQKEEAAELSGAGDILSGEVGGSNETATTTQIRIAQAMAQITIMNKRYTRARTAEGRNLARLNSVYLQDNEYFTVIDPFKGGPEGVQEKEIARADYLQDVDITVTADPRMASRAQRISEANTALQVIMTNPLTAQNIALVNAGMRNLFVAMDRPDLVAALEAVPPMPPMGQPGAPPQQPGQSAKGGTPPSTKTPPPAGPVPPRVPNAGPQPSNGEFANQGV
jgi:hypothetical protein